MNSHLKPVVWWQPDGTERIKRLKVFMSITSQGYNFMWVVRKLKINFLHKFQVHNTVSLTIVTKLYIRPPEHIHPA